MRFLCLHGYAFSVEVLQQQMEPITAHLPSDWEYEFLEAGMEPTELMLRKCQQVRLHCIHGANKTSKSQASPQAQLQLVQLSLPGRRRRGI